MTAGIEELSFGPPPAGAVRDRIGPLPDPMRSVPVARAPVRVGT